MAQQLTQQMATDIQAMMANVQVGYEQTNAARTALSTLISSGVATCRDVQLYNLQVKAVYAYQASVAGIIRANGGAPPSVPAPIYVGWRGVAGDAFANVDCNAAQMRGSAPVSPTLGAPNNFYINPQQVEWRQGALPSDNTVVSQVVAAAGNAAVTAGQLGAVQLLAVIPIIIIGIIVIVAATIVLKIVEALTDIPGKRETTKQVAIQAEQHRMTLEARAACQTACVAAGKDPIECAKGCTRSLPDFVAKFPGGGWGIFGTVAGVAVLGLAAYAGFKYVKAGGGGRAHSGGGVKYALTQRDKDRAIDADYDEVA
jgi:hypothetical protein